MICVRWPRDGGEALIIFSDKQVHAGPECAVPLLDLREETVRKELELNRRGEARLSDEQTRLTRDELDAGFYAFSGAEGNAVPENSKTFSASA